MEYPRIPVGLTKIRLIDCETYVTHVRRVTAEVREVVGLTKRHGNVPGLTVMIAGCNTAIGRWAPATRLITMSNGPFLGEGQVSTPDLIPDCQNLPRLSVRTQLPSSFTLPA